jgi:hypothetical protein
VIDAAGDFDLIGIASLAGRTTVAIGGRGAEPELAQRLRARLLHGDSIAGAAEFAQGFDA